ncbi:F420-dependent oxidoreductase-like protein [Antricoccus suffuscus]|uniref:F420-dependent oxidoreductase-like protein n=2 Tax=Antricoccus suffuscus TaxID=1629062 RepID=A0A2T0ZKD1_9ACTN|nr:F420-dependent oxidoreductase-like protein [Antricoccus suffuscus]
MVAAGRQRSGGLLLNGAMKLRIFTEPQQGASYGTLLSVAQATEKLGFDAFFRSDHYLVMGGGDGLPGPTDAFLTLAGLARETSTIRLGTLVSSATFRLPGVTAISVAQLDEMSGGRIELGLGTGWYDAEHTAYGIPFPALGERFDRLEEQLEVIDGLWRTPVGETYSFDGKHYTLKNSPALPKTVQQPGVPIVVGGGGKKRTPYLAAKYAAEFNRVFTSVDDTKAQFERVLAACDEQGRERSSLVLSAGQVVCVGRTEAEIKKRAEAIGRDVDELRANGLAGTPDEVVDKIGKFGDAGAVRMYMQILDLSDLDHLEVLASDVMAQL